MSDERIPLVTFKNPDTGTLHTYCDGDDRVLPKGWERAVLYVWHNQASPPGLLSVPTEICVNGKRIPIDPH